MGIGKSLQKGGAKYNAVAAKKNSPGRATSCRTFLLRWVLASNKPQCCATLTLRKARVLRHNHLLGGSTHLAISPSLPPALSGVAETPFLSFIVPLLLPFVTGT